MVLFNEFWTEITVGRVHRPAEPIHTAGRVYRHFVNAHDWRPLQIE